MAALFDDNNESTRCWVAMLSVCSTQADVEDWNQHGRMRLFRPMMATRLIFIGPMSGACRLPVRQYLS
ncbi:hypothetical protein [Allorhizobium borbori]|uniref:Uncharacterized protein n=1 Tax=Allorhizobium borbori TaxID=485907 RepID=A0A7W6P1W4_9HYPH|nr:hypothetical protein [Allorhizobium borbori]MBB4103209.1 hypothetical protein [Allorhizobium borbori]